MKVREQLIKRIAELPEDVLEEVDDFGAFIQKKPQSGGGRFCGSFARNIGAFDFWNDREDVDYSLNDLRTEACNSSRAMFRWCGSPDESGRD